MMRVPPKVWVGPTCLQVTRHAPQTPPPPLQDLFSVSSAVETGADNSEELLRKYQGSAVISPHEPEHSSDKSRVTELSVKEESQLNWVHTPGARINFFLRLVQETGSEVRQDI